MGSQLEVYIDSYGASTKKLVLSMQSPTSSSSSSSTSAAAAGAAQLSDKKSASSNDVNAFVHKSPERWIQAVVQSVTAFGLFVRPASYDVTGKGVAVGVFVFMGSGGHCSCNFSHTKRTSCLL